MTVSEINTKSLIYERLKVAYIWVFLQKNVKLISQYCTLSKENVWLC